VIPTRTFPWLTQFSLSQHFGLWSTIISIHRS
jgi:hypothetical protein